jgi:serine---pyruvate transaminase
MRKTRIFTPGPTPLMPEAQLAMARPIIHHRTQEFKELFLETRRLLQQIFRTENEMLILTASGTGAMEAAVCNLFSAEDQTLAVVAGKFGERWVELCQSFHVPCVTLIKEYGEAATAEEIAEALRRHPETKGLLIQACETSTATSHDLEAIGNLVREEFPEVTIVVDAITGVGCQPLEADQWGLDVVISGSQKAFALPPGLAFMSLSSRALRRISSAASPRYYFNLAKELKNQQAGQTAWTPNVSLVVALNAVCKEILCQGLDKVVAEAELMARCTRQGLLALDFRLLSSSPSSAATAAFPPEGISASELSKRLEQRFGLKVAGGQGELKGKIIRIAHLGYFDTLDVFCALSAIELCLMEMGQPVEPGSGVKAAMLEARQS